MKEFQIFIKAKSDKSIHTRKMYYDVISKFLKSMKVETIEDLQNLSASQLRDYILSKDMKASSKNSIIRVLKSFFSFLFDNDFLTVNQMTKVKKQSEGKHMIKMPSVDEMKIIMDNCTNNVTHLQIGLMSRMGLRRSEITNIQLKDICEDGKLLVRGKGNKEGILKLPNDLFEEIKKYISHKNRVESEFLFSYNGNQISTTAINIRITEYISSLGFSPERAKIITPHSFRRRCGTNVYNKTKDPYAVKAILRHSSLAVGERYVGSEQSEFEYVSENL